VIGGDKGFHLPFVHLSHPDREEPTCESDDYEESISPSIGERTIEDGFQIIPLSSLWIISLASV
jgi:hypothetical protein